MKKDAWAKIENEFNSQSSEYFRTATTLKNKYDNIKRNVKKQYAEEKTFSRGTGGGPNKSFQETAIASTVGEILQTRMTGERSIYDSDISNLQHCNAHLEIDMMEHQDIEPVYDENNADNEIITIFSGKYIVNKPTTYDDCNYNYNF